MLRVDDSYTIVIGTGSVIALPFMPSWLCNVRRKATEDWLTALKCQPVGTDGTIPGSPSPRHASEHQNFISTSPLAALSANIDCLRTDLLLIVLEGVVPFPMVKFSGIIDGPSGTAS